MPGLTQHATHLMPTGHMYRAQEQQQHAYALGGLGGGGLGGGIPRRVGGGVGDLSASARGVDQIQLAHAMQSLRMSGGGGQQQQNLQGHGQQSMSMGGGGMGNGGQQSGGGGPSGHGALSSNWRQRQ